MRYPSVIAMLALTMLLSLPLAAQHRDDHDQKKHDRIGHSDKDFERDQDGRLTRVRTEQDGAFAQVSVSAPGSTFSLNVSRGSTNDVASTTLNYSDIEEPADFSSITFTNIFGTIPNAAFTGNNTTSLVLDLDTTQLDPATSFSQTCTLVFDPFSEVCETGPLGTIHIAFQENGINRTRILQLDEEQVAGPVTTRTHQKADSGSADFQGTVFGVPVSTSQGSATIGVNHLSTVVITRQ